MLVSIITVCYNSEKTIGRTIQSILDQSYMDIEYIIIDGVSKDRTLEVVNGFQEAFISRYGRKIQVVSEPDKGIYDAMNKGIQRASGKVIGILNSDDYYERSAVETIASHMESDAMQICYGGVRIYSENKLESIIWYSHEFIELRMIAHPACFVSKKIYEKYGGYNTKYKSAADYEFMLRMNKKKDVEFIPIYEAVTNFSKGGMSSTLEGWKDKFVMLHDIGKVGTISYIGHLLHLQVMAFLFPQNFTKRKK